MFVEPTHELLCCWVWNGPQRSQHRPSTGSLERPGDSDNSLGSDLSICTVTTAEYHQFSSDFYSWNITHRQHIGFLWRNNVWIVGGLIRGEGYFSSFGVTMGCKMYQADWSYLFKYSLLRCSLSYQGCSAHQPSNHLCFFSSPWQWRQPTNLGITYYQCTTVAVIVHRTVLNELKCCQRRNNTDPMTLREVFGSILFF